MNLRTSMIAVGGTVSTAIIEVRKFMALHRTEVIEQQLVVPAGYTEAPWPGYEHVQQVFPTSADQGAYWKRAPSQLTGGVAHP